MVIVQKVVKEFIESIDYSSEVESYDVQLPEGCEVTVSNMLFARVGLTGYLNGEAFTITFVDYETCTIKFDGCPVSEPSTFSMDAPFFFYGTAYQVSAQLSRIKDDASKVPMVVLFDVTRERLGAYDSAIATTPTLNIAFLDRNDFKNWTVEEHYNNVITPMRNLLELFMVNVHNEAISPFADTTTITPTVENHANFGVFQQNKGHVNSLLNEHLSGCTLSGDFPVRKCCNDKC